MFSLLGRSKLRGIKPGEIKMTHKKLSILKKTIVVFFLVFAMAGPSYALNVLDNLLGKKVLLNAIHRTVLVNRITGEVKYILSTDNRIWIPLTGTMKRHCQVCYDTQIALLKE
jgi:hypothetical protein